MEKLNESIQGNSINNVEEDLQDSFVHKFEEEKLGLSNSMFYDKRCIMLTVAVSEHMLTSTENAS